MQKVVRKYFRDARCLTDIVRCVILFESVRFVFCWPSYNWMFICEVEYRMCLFLGQIGDLHIVLEHFIKKCVVDSSISQRSDSGSSHDEDTLLGEDLEQKHFVLCQIKDRFFLACLVKYMILSDVQKDSQIVSCVSKIQTCLHDLARASPHTQHVEVFHALIFQNYRRFISDLFLLQIYNAASHRIPRHLHASRGWMDYFEWVWRLSSFCHGGRFREKRNHTDAHLWGELIWKAFV